MGHYIAGSTACRQSIIVPFTYTIMPGNVLSKFSVPANAYVTETNVVITTPFTGGSSPLLQLLIYNAGGSTTLQPTTFPDLTVAGQNLSSSSIVVTNAGPVQVVITGTAAAGAGYAIVNYFVPSI